MDQLTIGRINVGGDSIVVNAVGISGDRVTIRGSFSAASQSDAKAQVDQLAGYVISSDEPFVPVSWTGGPDLDGFYRVLDASSDGVAATAFQGVFSFSVTLERVRGYAAPLFEATLVGGKRASSAVTTFTRWHALPASVKGYETGTLTPNTATRVSADGDLSVFYDALPDVVRRPQFFLPTTDWYDGAATIRMGGRVVVGRQVPNDVNGWEVSNGVIRLVPAGSFAGAVGTESIRLEAWTGTQWVVVDHQQLGRVLDPASGSGPSLAGEPHTITVLRNSPEQVVIRLTYDAASLVAGSRFAVYLDISLRRGSRMAGLTVSSRGAYGWGFGYGANGLTGLGANAGGYQNTSVVNGVRRVWAIESGTDVFADSAMIYRNTLVQRAIFGLGAVVGASPTGIETPTEVVKQWAAALTERVVVVTR